MKSTNRIGLLLALVFLLPAMFFSVYEISSLNKNEEMIQEIYNKQLEALLFSVNQYADDVLGNWISRTETGIDAITNETEIPSRINDLLTYNSSLRTIFVGDTTPITSAKRIFSLNTLVDQDYRIKIDSALLQNKSLIEDLVRYKKSGFQKVVVFPYSWRDADNLQCL